MLKEMTLQRFAILFFISCKLFVGCTELEDYAIKENDRWIFKNIAKCLSEVTELSASKNQDVIVIFREAHNEDAVLISTKYPIVVLTEEILNRKLPHARNRAVAYVFSNQTITEILNYIFWDTYTKFIIVCSDKTQMETDFAEFWEERTVNILALHYNIKNEQIHLFTFFPYEDDHCDKMDEIALLAIWNPTSGTNVRLFPPKVTDLHKCPLYVTLLERPPSVIESENGTMSGVEVYILHLVAKAINATPKFELLHKKKTVYKSRGNNLMLELTENHSHAVAGSLLMTTSVSSLSEGIQYSTSLCITIAVPKIKNNSYFYIFATLLTGKYFLITTFIIFAYIIFFYVFYKAKEKTITLAKTCWMILSPIIGGPRIKIKYFMSRTFFVSWLFAAFIFCKIFEASISSSVLAPEQSKQLENLTEIFQSTLTLRGENFLMQEVLPRYISENRKANVDLKSIDERHAMEIIAEKKDSAFLGSQMNLLWTFLGRNDLEESIYIQEECVMRYSPVIQIRKNSPLYYVFFKYITALSESGIIKQAFDLVLFNFFTKQNRQKMRTDAPPLSLKQMMGAFVILGIGSSLSCICFVGEVLYSMKGKKIQVVEREIKKEEIFVKICSGQISN